MAAPPPEARLPLNKGKSAIAFSEPMYARDPCQSALPGVLCVYKHPTHLVRVRKGRNLGGPVDLLHGRVNLFLAHTGLLTHLRELLLVLVLLAQLLEHACQVHSLLRSDLRGRCVLRGSTVSNGIDALGTEHVQIVVHHDTPALGLRSRELGHEVTSDGAGGVSGRPDQETVGDLAHLFRRVLDCNGTLADVFDHGTGQDVNLVLLEG